VIQICATLTKDYRETVLAKTGKIKEDVVPTNTKLMAYAIIVHLAIKYLQMEEVA